MKSRRALSLWGILLFFGFGAAAQDDCLTTQVNARLQAEKPKIRQLDVALEKAWRSYRPLVNRKAAPYELPIVFHVVHDGGSENLEDATLVQAMERTNAAFANLDFYDRGAGVDTEISFCFARRTPDNLATNGITRTRSPLTQLEAPAQDLDIKDLIRWEPRDYINVWVVQEICGLGLGCGVAGYAYYPSAHGGRFDGILVEARHLTTEAGITILVHELGHYLGLYHTFEGGCKNDDCTRDGDRVCDTPPDQSKAAVPCSGTVNTCTTDTDSGFTTDQDDQFTNYLDYGSRHCRNDFTAGQRDRMHFFIEGRRRSLLESFACREPCPALVTAGIGGLADTVEVGIPINLQDLSTNATDYRWQIGDSLVSTAASPTVSFPETGTYFVRQYVSSGESLCRPDSITQLVRVVCPVEASFSGAGSQVGLGEAVTFTNTSTGDGAYRWTIDGVAVATTDDLTYTFSTAGLYRICLESDNGFCSAESCRIVFAAEAPCGGEDCPPFDDCGAPFAYFYQGFADGEVQASFSRVVPHADGYYLSGRIGSLPLVASIGLDGAPRWQLQLYPSGSDHDINDLKIDAEGMLVGLGTSNTATGGRPNSAWDQGFAFRIEPATGNLLWARTYGSQGQHIYLAKFVDIANASTVSLAGAIDPRTDFSSAASTDRGIIVTLSLADGSIAGSQQYDSGGEEGFTDAVPATAGGFFLGGRWRTGGSGTSGTPEPFVTALSADETVRWTQKFTATPPEVTLFGQPVMATANNQLIVAMAGGNTSGTIKELPFYLAFLDITGTIIRSLEITTGFPEATGTTFDYLSLRPVNIVPVTDGFYLLAQASNEGFSSYTSALFLYRFDTEGNFCSANFYPGHLTYVNPFERQLAVKDDLPLLPSSMPAGLSLLRFTELGIPAEACVRYSTRPVTTRSIAITGLTYDLLPTDLRLFSEQFFAEPTQLVQDPASCLPRCDPDEDCLDCTCLPAAPPQTLPDTALCAGDTLRFLSPPEETTALCVTSIDTVFLTEPGQYLVGRLDSCQNLVADTIRVNPRSRPNLQLRNDTTLCQNATLVLTAQEGFATYRWVDGTDERSFTAADPGTYWVEATDSCGVVQRDSVTIFVDPATVIDLGPDRTICQGDTITFDLDGFASYQWSQSTYIDCTDCPTVNFFPDRDTLLIVAATLDAGCVSSDSLRVTVQPRSGSYRSEELCAGDSILFDGRLVAAPGIFFNRPEATYCSNVDTLELFLNDFRAELVLGGAAGQASVNASGGTEPYDYQWSSGQTGPEVNGLADGDYVVTVTEASGCSVILPLMIADTTGGGMDTTIMDTTGNGMDTMMIDTTVLDTMTVIPIEELVFVPTAFSPNGDGTNDVFRPFFSEEVVGVGRLAIYDRWGAEAFVVENLAVDDPALAWNGERANVGVHVFVLELILSSGERRLHFGEVLVLR